MIAEVISFGDELTSGQRLDTNSRWLSERLGELGLRVAYHTTVVDDLGADVQVFRVALERADVIVTTGGLGPTADDLTREALAEATGRHLVRDEEALAHVRALFARRRRPMPERNIVQAMFPTDSRVIPNPEGTAPGIDLEVARGDRGPARVFALPGVPAEMHVMFNDSVAPAILAMSDAHRRVLRHRRIHCFGAGESDVEQMLPDLVRRGRDPVVGITASKTTITLRITASGATPEACDEAMEPTVQTIRDCLGTLVFGEDDDELQDVVVRMLRARGQTLAVAEWGTDGLVARWLSAADALGDAFLGGSIVRGEPSFAAMVDGGGGLLPQHGGNSGEAAAALAVACRQRFSTDCGLGVSAIPTMDSASAEAGFIYFALCTSAGVEVKAVRFSGHPDLLTIRNAKVALNFMRLTLTEPG